MEISIKKEELQKKSLFVATPMYGGQNHGLYAKACLDLQALCMQYGIKVKFSFLFNESLITRARNYLVDEFLHRSDCTHLLFLDSDIHFNPQDVIALLALDKDVIGAPYPKKAISWEKIKLAVDKGYADKNPNTLEEFVGDYVFNPADGISEFRLDEPVKVKEGGTGFMMIARSAFDKFAKAYPEKSYKPDHVRTKNFDGSREIMAYFDCVIDPDSKRYLSEDYMFCQWARKAGADVWMLPWIKLKHSGHYIFGGSLQALASIGATPTAGKDVPKR
jgi:hypothetical protein